MGYALRLRQPPQQSSGGYKLCNEYCRKAQHELYMPGFVVNGEHAQQHGKRAAQRCNGEQTPLRYAPATPF